MSTETDPAIATTAGAKQWLGLAVLALPTLLLSLDITVLHLAVPHLSEELKPTSSQLLWIIDIYGFMIAGLLVTMGTLGDRIGRRRLLIIGSAVFGIASAAAAFSTSAEMLIASRALMGIAGATLMPSTLALISNMFRDARQRAFAIGIWATMFSVGVAIGPIVGGALLEHFWWGSVFLLGVPVMLLLLITAPLLLPEFRDRTAGRLDIASVALIITSMLAITFGIKEFSTHGLAPVPIGSVALGVILGAFFVRRQRRLTDPLLDLRLFGNRALSFALLALLVSTATLGGIYLFITQFLQLVTETTPLVAGLLLLPSAAVLIVTSIIAPVLARRFRPGHIVAVALAVSAVGFVVLSQVSGPSTVPLVVIGLVLIYAGCGPTISLGTELVVGGAPPEKAGAASALSETSTELGVALGIAVFGSIGVAIYRLGLAGESLAGIDAAVAQEARETLAAALEAARDLPGELGSELVSFATSAFIDGFSAAAWLGAALLVIAVPMTAVALRHIGPSGKAQEAGDREIDAVEAEVR